MNSIAEYAKRAMPSAAYAPTATLGRAKSGTSANAAFAAASKKEYGADYYLRSALAGGLCCGITHGVVTPVDVVKVRARATRTAGRRAHAKASERAGGREKRRTRRRRRRTRRSMTDRGVILSFVISRRADAHATRSGQVRRYAQRLP